ncbi:MAG: glycoside hydrolase family protein [Armatimonadota bacterium]
MIANIDVGSRRELLVDDWLIERLEGGARLQLHPPTPREAVLELDRPWEGSMCGYITVLRDGDRCRMYYRGWEVDIDHPGSHGEALHIPRPACICLAESDDGIHWERPALNLFDYGGNRDNNIVWMGVGDDLKGLHGFSPFLDTNPACPPDARYKAVGGTEGWPISGLFAMASPDGVRWSLLEEQPIITTGAFDSHNTVFWDDLRGEYRAYVRDFRDGRRDIRTATSPDFLHWTEPAWLDYPGAPPEQLYTNNVLPYDRAPHLFVSVPARYVERPWTPTMEGLPELAHRRRRAAVNERFGTAVSDAVFMSSRDGQTFRRWGEAFIRPGLRAAGNWAYGDNYPAWGMLETASELPGGGRELSLYTTENYWRGACTTIRRFTLRMDGFVSLAAPLTGGEMVTKPLRFTGERLSLNLSTSAAGGARVELQDDAGRPLKGFTLADCWEIVGDTLDYTVRWKHGSSFAAFAGQSVRLRVVLSDADLYSFQFTA